jgi:hypothetical protein
MSRIRRTRKRKTSGKTRRNKLAKERRRKAIQAVILSRPEEPSPKSTQ